MVYMGGTVVISQKSLYALRALFELAKRTHQGPVKIGVIADAQAIPPRFLEMILNRLRHSGLVGSRRGSNGGYYLAKSPKDISVGDVLRIMQGPIDPVPWVSGGSKSMSTLNSDCVFLPLWKNVRETVNRIYDSATFQDLVDTEKEGFEKLALHYMI